MSQIGVDGTEVIKQNNKAAIRAALKEVAPEMVKKEEAPRNATQSFSQEAPKNNSTKSFATPQANATASFSAPANNTTQSVFQSTPQANATASFSAPATNNSTASFTAPKANATQSFA